MARPKKKNYDPDAVMKELMDTVTSIYVSVEAHPSLQTIADELNLNPMKVRKLLITAGVYESAAADEIGRLRSAGKTVNEIMSDTGLSRASVHSYLPYSKIAYKGNEVSVTAERIRKYRERRKAVEVLQREKTIEYLWAALLLFQGYPFRTTQNLKFTYSIRGAEMFVNGKEKSITKSTVELAFEKVLEIEGNVSGPKKLGCFGASYLYPVFVRLGLIVNKM